MALQYTPTTIPLLISTIILSIILFTAIGRRHVAGARSFIWLMSCVTLWTVCYALALSGKELQTNVFWSKCQFIGIVFVPVSWLVFSLEYSHLYRFVNRRTIALLSIVPLLTIALIWTNDYHHLFWTSISGQLVNGLWVIQEPPGSAFWIYTAFSYVCLIVGSFLFVRQALKGPYLVETQSLMMILGAAVPWIINIVYLFWFKSSLSIDPTPFTLVISGIFYTWGLFRFGLFNLLPMAAETVIEGIQDGVMIIDQAGQVVYINLAFSEYTGISSKEAIGSTAKEVLARWPELAGEFGDRTPANSQITIQLTGDTLRSFEMRISPLYDRIRRFGGQVFTLREISNPAGTRAVDLTSATARSKLMLMTTKASGEIIAVNDHFVDVLGYTRTEIIEKSSISIWESIEQRSALLRKSRGEGFENMEINLMAKSGQKINMIASAKSLLVNTETYLFFAMRENR